MDLEIKSVSDHWPFILLSLFSDLTVLGHKLLWTVLHIFS